MTTGKERDPIERTHERPTEPAPDAALDAPIAEVAGVVHEEVGHPARRLVVGITVLAVLAVLYTVYFARAFLAPIAIALLLSFLLSPVIRGLARVHVPPAAGAGLVMLVLVGGVAAAAYSLAGPTDRWVSTAPEMFGHAAGKLRSFIRPVQKVATAADQVERATAVNADAHAREVVVKGPGLGERLFGTTENVVATIVEVLLLLYFLLAAGDLFLQKLIKVLPRMRDRETVVELARAVESSISAYLLTMATINIAEGVIVGVAMWLLGMPTPALWGAMVAALEFIPYVGAFMATAVLTVVAAATFDSVARAVAVPLTYVAINFLQGNLITPLVMSRRLTLNPVAVFLTLAFWWWAWGVPGAFLAVPMLAVFKICCDHLEPLAEVGEFIGGRDPGERRELVRTPDETAEDQATAAA
jgi:predicted PurR-regulated permease PerM